MILTIDCGTQSTRALLFSIKGELIDKEQIHYQPYYSPKPGWAEQDTEIYWNALVEATQKLQLRNKQHYNKIRGIGITALRGTMLNIDRNGKVLRPAITWLDQRMAKNENNLKLPIKWALRILGLEETVKKLERKGYSNWIKQNQPDIWNKTYKYLSVSAFLNFKLTGEFKDSIASQIGHIPFNYKKQRWSNKNDYFDLTKDIYPIEKNKLVSLINPGKKIGEISNNIADLLGLPENTPVIACGSDKGCETLGMGVTDNKMASLSFGTTATVQTTTKTYFEPIKYLPAYPAVIPKYWNPEIEIYRGFWMINWFKKEFAIKELQTLNNQNTSVEEILDGFLHKSPPGSLGLIVQPYWSPGLDQGNAKGAMIGFGDVHKKEHIYRSVIEGLCYGLLDGMKKLEKRGQLRFEKIAVSGGASQSDEICQIAADVFNLELLRGETHETSGLGAAIITAFGVGVYKNLNEATNAMVRYKDTFKPKPQNVKLYQSIFNEVYLEMYPKLESLYKKIRIITGYPEE